MDTGSLPLDDASARLTLAGRERPHPARQWVAMALIVLAVLGSFFDAFSGPFMFDDLSSITDNPHVRHLWPVTTAMAAPDDTTLSRRPVTALTLALDYAVFGLSVGGYHATNLAFHLWASLLLFGIVRRTLLIDGRLADDSIWIATGVAILWAVHPVQTEVIDYIVQRTEGLMGFCFLLTLYCFIRGFESQTRWLAWYTGAVVACAVGMGCKEVMIGAPILVLLYDRQFLAGSFRSALRSRGWLYFALAATWTVLAVLVARQPLASNSRFNLPDLTPLDYLRTEAGVIAYYVRLFVWPYPLVIDYYDWPVSRSWGTVPWFGALLTLLLLAATARLLVRRSWLGFAGAWFFVILAPTSTILPMRTEAVAERRLYLPLAALATVTVVGTYRVILRLADRGRVRQVFSVVIATIALLLGAVTVLRNADYRDDVTLYTDAISKRPNNARLYDNRANVYTHRGLYDLAAADYATTLRLNPEVPDAYNNLANMLSDQDKLAQAVPLYLRAIAIEPSYVTARYNLGNAFVRLGQLPSAERQFRACTQIAPDFAKAYYKLGLVLNLLHRPREAMEALRRSIELEPRFVLALNQTALMLATSDDSSVRNGAEAVRVAERLCEVGKRRDPVAFETLAAAYAEAGRYTDAVRAEEMALELYRASGNPFPAAKIASRLKLYRSGQPLRLAPR